MGFSTKWMRMKVYWDLGFRNLIKVAYYRFQVKLGGFVRKLPVKSFQNLEWQVPSDDLPSLNWSGKSISIVEQDRYAYFFKTYQPISNPPRWFINPWTQKNWEEISHRHWSKVGYFPAPGEDIKIIWELSRFYWITQFAIHYRVQHHDHVNRQLADLERIHIWLNDWCQKNPVNTGVNWLCAQETGIRLINFILAQYILEVTPGPAEIEFCEAHAYRILKTLYYAEAQCNNHATTEAGALYVVGMWLGQYDARAKSWAQVGYARLERLVNRLILEDGTFAQYSVTYHRMVLDTLSLCVIFQRRYGGPAFSDQFIRKYQLAFEWLYHMVDPLSGDASNLGSNDGTLLFKLDACDYRDFRPSLQLASVVLRNACLYGEGPWNTILAVFGLSYEPSPLPIALVGKKFNQGGYVCFRGKGHWAVLKYPRYRYRPPQCDALHVDVWGAGENIFLDSGTYSYNASALEMADFSGVKGHNTLQFDHREQMPRISRFLYGGWLKTKNMYYGALSDTEQGWSGLYHDAWGVTHQRTILLESTQYRIVDRFSGFKESAVIRWHSPFLDWVKTESGYRRKNILIEVRVNGKLIELQNRKSEVSRYYLNKEPCTVFIYEIKDSPGTIETLILINPES